jgi:hypothetical protein
MKKKMIGIFVCMLLILTIIPVTSGQKDNTQIPLLNNSGKALIGYIYMELDPNSTQAQDILDNIEQIPVGFLALIDITLENPNQGLDRDLIIAPFVRTLIGDWIGIGPFFDPIMPEETSTIHIKILLGAGIHMGQGMEEGDMLVVYGWAPLVSWEY